MIDAHKKGTDFLSALCGAKAPCSDIVIATNGEYPLVQNMYQAVKGMTAAEACVKENGVIIMLARSNDGIGGDHFYIGLKEIDDIDTGMNEILSRGRLETEPDQWMVQILLRILKRAKVVYVSQMPDETVKDMNMIPAYSIDEAMDIAGNILSKDNITINVIPEGVSVIVTGE